MANPYRFSEPTVNLAKAGIGLRPIAEALGVTTASVSRYLSGKSRPPAALFPVLRALAGPEIAEEIEGLLNGTKRRAA